MTKKAKDPLYRVILSSGRVDGVPPTMWYIAKRRFDDYRIGIAASASADPVPFSGLNLDDLEALHALLGDFLGRKRGARR